MFCLGLFIIIIGYMLLGLHYEIWAFEGLNKLNFFYNEASYVMTKILYSNSNDFKFQMWYSRFIV